MHKKILQLFRPCFGFSLQGGTKVLAVSEACINLLMIIFLTTGISEVWKDWKKDMGEFWLYYFRFWHWVYFYIYFGVNVIFAKLQYTISHSRNKLKLKLYLWISTTAFILWVILCILHFVYLHGEDAFLVAIMKTQDTTSGIFLFYKLYALWVLWCFLKEIRHYRRFNAVIKRLSDKDVVEIMNGENDTNDNEPYNHDFEIPTSQIDLEEGTVLGQGAFGIIFKGYFHKDDNTIVEVAVKTVANSDILYFKSLLSELKILSYIGQNENIVNLIGACTSELELGKIYVLVELCSNGSLLNYLREQRASVYDELFIQQLNALNQNCCNRSTYVTISENALSQRDLLKWSMQTARGMEYISSRKVIHGDLAARNVLLTSDFNIKIADFGLSRQLHHYTSYLKNKNNKSILPWRWMACESLSDLRFSSNSDAWSFGITVWEYYTCGCVPYVEWEYSPEFLDAIQSQNLRLGKPCYASEEIYKLMKSCWKLDPKLRPSFSSLKDSMQLLLFQ